MSRRIRRRRRRDGQASDLLRQVRIQAGLDREEYFSQDGATPRGWRGVHTVSKNRKRYSRKVKHRNRPDD